MQTIASLKEGDWIEETYLVTAKQVSTAKNGVTYLSIKLADKTGEIDGKLWDNADEVAGKFEREDFVRIKGIAANYQGTMQIKMKTLEKVDDGKVDIANFIQTSSRNPDDMIREIRTMAAGITNAHLKQLMTAFLNDAPFMELFKRVPAAKTLHHNYVGGLLEHVVELMSLARDVAEHFPSIDVDLLTAGAFLHDIGKVRELSIRKSIEYTTEGRLIGHISLGYEMVVEKIDAIPAFPAELAMLLKHIVLSHHGEYEFGSPKRPKIQEAIVINYLDDLSAKINNFQATLKKENVGEGEWTTYSKMHDRYLYRQTAHGGSRANPTDDLAETGEGQLTGKKGSRNDGRVSKGSGTSDSSGKLPLDI
ncbi:MAG TPA: HD domain-containing protein [Nitrospirota bacterium]|nr:HD domain-containing protein [Nitrospirota bacterium]